MACSQLNYDVVASNYGEICWLETKIPAEDTRNSMRECCPVGSEVLSTDGGCFSYCAITDEERQQEWASCMTREIEETNFLGKFGGDLLCFSDGAGDDGGDELKVRDLKGDMAIAKAIEGIIEMVETMVFSVPVGSTSSSLELGTSKTQQPTATSKQSTSTKQQTTATTTPLYFAITHSSSVTTNSSAISNTTSPILPPKSNTTLSNSSLIVNSTTGSSNITTISPPPIYPNTTKVSPTTLVAGPTNTPAPVSTAPTPHGTSVLHIPGVITSEGISGRRVSVGSLFVFGLLVSGLVM